VNGVLLGRFHGIAVKAHWSVPVTVVLLAALLAESVLPAAARGATAPAYWVVAVVTTCVLMGSLLAHELAHAMLARRFGVRVNDITLWALGGMTAFEEEPPTPRAAALVAVAGPVVSLLLGGVFVVGAFSVDPSWLGGLPAAALNWLAVMNILLGLFNLVPAAPLDGGRVLRAYLWSRIGDRDKATSRAATVGRAFGSGLVVLGVVTLMSGYLGGLWLALVGWFLAGTAAAERQQAQVFGRLRDMKVRDVMSAHPVIAPGWWTVDAFATHVAADGVRHRFFPVVDFDGRPVGVVGLPRLATAQQHSRIQDAAVPLDQRSRAEAGERLTDVLRRASLRPGTVVVIVEHGALVGVLTPTDIARTMDLCRLGVAPAIGSDRSQA
jgi:Zn-dependent protease